MGQVLALTIDLGLFGLKSIHIVGWELKSGSYSNNNLQGILYLEQNLGIVLRCCSL